MAMLTVEEIKGFSPEKLLKEFMVRHGQFSVLAQTNGQGATQTAVNLGEEVKLLKQRIMEALELHSWVKYIPWECDGCGAKGIVESLGLSEPEVWQRKVKQHNDRVPKSKCAWYRAKEPSVAATAQA